LTERMRDSAAILHGNPAADETRTVNNLGTTSSSGSGANR
jgi:hypothetical protein